MLALGGLADNLLAEWQRSMVKFTYFFSIFFFFEIIDSVIKFFIPLFSIDLWQFTKCKKNQTIIEFEPLSRFVGTVGQPKKSFLTLSSIYGEQTWNKFRNYWPDRLISINVHFEIMQLLCLTFDYDSVIVPLRFRKVEKVWCGGARETLWATCPNRVTPSKTKEFLKSSRFLRS